MNSRQVTFWAALNFINHLEILVICDDGALRRAWQMDVTPFWSRWESLGVRRLRFGKQTACRSGQTRMVDSKYFWWASTAPFGIFADTVRAKEMHVSFTWCDGASTLRQMISIIVEFMNNAGTNHVPIGRNIS